MVFEVAEAAVTGGAVHAAPGPKSCAGSMAVVRLARSKVDKSASNPSLTAAASPVVL